MPQEMDDREVRRLLQGEMAGWTLVWRSKKLGREEVELGGCSAIEDTGTEIPWMSSLHPTYNIATTDVTLPHCQRSHLQTLFTSGSHQCCPQYELDIL